MFSCLHAKPVGLATKAKSASLERLFLDSTGILIVTQGNNLGTKACMGNHLSYRSSFLEYPLIIAAILTAAIRIVTPAKREILKRTVISSSNDSGN